MDMELPWFGWDADDKFFSFGDVELKKIIFIPGCGDRWCLIGSQNAIVIQVC